MMKIKYFTFILILFSIFLERELRLTVVRTPASELFPKTAVELIDKFDYQELRNVSLEILEKCPPEDCIIVGLGRSPAAFIAFLREIGSDAFNLPLSGFKLHPESFEYNADLIPALHEHFDRYLKIESVNHKKVMIIDYSLTGTSLFAAQYQLQEYLKANSMDNSVDALAITSYPGHIKSTEESLKMKKAHIVALDFGDLNKNLLASKFDDFAEYGETTVKSWGRAPVNKRYSELRSHIANLIESDEQIKGISISNYRDFIPVPDRDYPYSCKNLTKDIID